MSKKNYTVLRSSVHYELVAGDRSANANKEMSLIEMPVRRVVEHHQGADCNTLDAGVSQSVLESKAGEQLLLLQLQRLFPFLFLVTLCVADPFDHDAILAELDDFVLQAVLDLAARALGHERLARPE